MFPNKNIVSAAVSSRLYRWYSGRQCLDPPLRAIVAPSVGSLPSQSTVNDPQQAVRSNSQEEIMTSMRDPFRTRRTMRWSICALTALAVTMYSDPLAAAEKWFGKGVLVAVSEKTVKTEDRPDHTLSIFDCDGAVINAEGKPFLDKARYQIVGLVDSGVSGHGYKTFTEADGSKVFAKYTVTQVKLPDILGTFEFTGGTGKYMGINGGGNFHVIMLSDAAQYDELRGEYTIPAATR
jgi:hypothetical protein